MHKTVVFAYHDIGCIGIESLLAADYTIEAVFTHTDDPKENHFFGSVAQLCAQRGIAVYAPDNINHPSWIQHIRQLQPHFLFSFYYRNLLNEELLAIGSGGAFNLHGSLLPRYRGRAPVNWVLVNGETETGVTLHRMVKRADAGSILAQQRIPITHDDTALTLHGKLREAARTLLTDILPRLTSGDMVETEQDEKLATKFGRRTPSDGDIDWNQSVQQIYNLIRAVTLPYPGAFSFVNERKIIIWSSLVIEESHDQLAGVIISVNPLQITCGNYSLEVVTGQQDDSGLFLSGSQLAREMELCVGMRLHSSDQSSVQGRILVVILGVNSFLGSHLSERMLTSNAYEIYGLDTNSNTIEHLKKNQNFHFIEANVVIQTQCVESYIEKCDIVLPLATLATSSLSPLELFERIFEEDLKIVRLCVQYNKRLVFPSSAVVYGLCEDPQLDEKLSNLTLGPTQTKGWMYSASLQTLERVISAYGQRGLQVTIFRPFNWIEPQLRRADLTYTDSSGKLDDLLRSLVEGIPIQMRDGDQRKLNITDTDDAIEAVLLILENKNRRCDGQIINIGHPLNEVSYQQLAEEVRRQFEVHPLRKCFPKFAGFHQLKDQTIAKEDHLDISHFQPSITTAQRLLNWTPKSSLPQTISKLLDHYLKRSLDDIQINHEKMSIWS